MSTPAINPTAAASITLHFLTIRRNTWIVVIEGTTTVERSTLIEATAEEYEGIEASETAEFQGYSMSPYIVIQLERKTLPIPPSVRQFMIDKTNEISAARS